MSRPLAALKAFDWMVMLMQGYVHAEHVTLDNLSFDFVIISRRSCLRNGTLLIDALINTFDRIAVPAARH